MDWIKALPSGNEPDVVLVSCAGGARSEALEPQQLARMVRLLLLLPCVLQSSPCEQML